MLAMQKDNLHLPQQPIVTHNIDRNRFIPYVDVYVVSDLKECTLTQQCNQTIFLRDQKMCTLLGYSRPKTRFENFVPAAATSNLSIYHKLLEVTPSRLYNCTCVLTHINQPIVLNQYYTLNYLSLPMCSTPGHTQSREHPLIHVSQFDEIPFEQLFTLYPREKYVAKDVIL